MKKIQGLQALHGATLLPKTTLTDFEVYPGSTIEGHAFSSVPMSYASGAPQYWAPLQPLHFVIGIRSTVVVENEKFDHIEERMRAIEGRGNYGFIDMSKLCLVPDVVIPLKFKVTDFDKYKSTTCPKNHQYGMHGT